MAEYRQNSAQCLTQRGWVNVTSLSLPTEGGRNSNRAHPRHMSSEDRQSSLPLGALNLHVRSLPALLERPGGDWLSWTTGTGTEA
jgi:hypothetical protein